MCNIKDALRDSPAVIAMDIMFFGNSDEARDETLRASCEKNGNVVAGTYINYKTDADGKGYIDHFSIESVEQPFLQTTARRALLMFRPMMTALCAQ